MKDRDGAATAADLGVQQLAKGVDPFPAPVGDSGTVRAAPEARHVQLDTFLDVRGSHGKDSLGLGFLAEPEIDLDRDREITLDGRQLREIAADVGRRTQTRQLAHGVRPQGGRRRPISGAVQVPIKYDSIFAAPTRKVTDGQLRVPDRVAPREAARSR